MLFSGASFQSQMIPVLWLVALVLMMFRLRLVCFAYVVGLIVVLQPIVERFPDLQEQNSLQWFISPLMEADAYSLILLVGVLHVMEGLLVRWQGSRMATPMFFMSKRGKLIGGYHMQRFWPVPLLLIAPWVGESSIWEILTDPKLVETLLIFLPFPVIIGFSDMTVTHLPAEKARSTSNGLLLYGMFVIGLAFLVLNVVETAIVSGLLMMIAHESLRWYARAKERKLLPLFTNSNLGMKILAVLPGSAAAKLGMMPGETIHKVNGVQVQSRQQLYEAMNKNSAYCKLEVINLDGQVKFLNRAMFAGEHHQLGIVLSPDDDVVNYARMKEHSLLSYLRIKIRGVLQKGE
jgi:membrane-associated protease RseP (regulator of RpoE activity)